MKNVLITGASGGMGKATCSILKEAGFKVFGVDVNECENFVGDKFFKADLTDEKSVERLKEQVLSECPSFYAIIHMAGVYDLNSLVEMDEQSFLRIFECNLFSVFRINKAFIGAIEKGGKIIITSSELAPLDPLPFTGVYAITKSALEKYAFSLRHELNLLGIKVSVIRPGAVKTGLLKASTVALDKFCQNTSLYPFNAKRFKKIVDSVENKNIPPQKIGKIALKALKKKRPRFTYSVNRNFLLRVLSALPDGLQVKIISSILKERKKKTPI